MVTIVHHTGFQSLQGPTPPGFRLSLYPCLIAIPQLYVRVFGKGGQPQEKLLAEFFIPPVGPGSGHFQDVALLVQKTQYRVAGTFHPVLFSNMAMERRGGPEGPHCTSRLLELFENLLLLLTR
jgi:hypothetical protein